MLNFCDRWRGTPLSSGERWKQDLSPSVLSASYHIKSPNVLQKHFTDLFPLVTGPAPEVLAQAALFVVLRDQPDLRSSSPWTSLASRCFGVDVYERTITLQSEDASLSDSTVDVKCVSPGIFDVTVNGTTVYKSVPAYLPSHTSLNATISDRSLNTTIVPQPPPPALPASSSPHTMERLHVFHDGHKTTLTLPSPT